MDYIDCRIHCEYHEVMPPLHNAELICNIMNYVFCTHVGNYLATGFEHKLHGYYGD